MNRRVAGLIGLLLVLGLSPAAAGTTAPSGEPALTGDCGPDEEPPGDPARLLRHRASHVPPLDLCAAWIEPVWAEDVDEGRLAGLDVTVEVAGDLAERPELSWYEVQGRYSRADGQECRVFLRHFDRPPVWEPFNVELHWRCDHPDERVAGLSAGSQFEWADIDPSFVSLEGSTLHVAVPFDGFEPWARVLGDELAAAGVLEAPRVSSGVHGHLPYRNPPPVLVDQMTGGGIALPPEA